MSANAYAPTVNCDGFTDDDVAARRSSLRGERDPYDGIVVDVRAAYRSGWADYRSSHSCGNGDRGIQRRLIEAQLKRTFPTSQVACDYDETYSLGITIEVSFPH